MKSEEFIYPCGCSLITEPLSFYQWHPCKIHKDLDMEVTLDLLGETAERTELEDIPLEITFS